MSKQVSGIVEAKGDKYNGSVKVDGTWYNFRKGVDHSPVRDGQHVLLELEPWEFKGKSGMNVASFTVKEALKEAPTQADKAAQEVPAETRPKGRDFDKEAHGKTRCALFEAALQSPILAQRFYTKEASLEDVLTEVKLVVEEGVKFVFGE